MKLSGQENVEKKRSRRSWLICLFCCRVINVGEPVTMLCMLGCAVLVSPPFRARFRLPKGVWVPARCSFS